MLILLSLQKVNQRKQDKEKIVLFLLSFSKHFQVSIPFFTIQKLFNFQFEIIYVYLFPVKNIYHKKDSEFNCTGPPLP